MSDLNTVSIIGRLTRDPEVRYTSGGMPIVTLGIAVNGREKNAAGEWGEKPNYFDVTLFGDRFEKLAAHLAKGKRLGITGRLEWSSWETDGVKRSKVSIVGNEVQMLDSAPMASTEAPIRASQPAGFAASDFVPAGNATAKDDDIRF